MVILQLVLEQNLMHNSFRKSAKIALVLVYLVIAAGAIVRMTGSGMGCPDWPKCFGYYIPPTQASELEWAAKKNYKEGHVIILNESLRVAKTDFVTGTIYASENWEPYTKHEYAIFNPVKTWIEYINRLVTVLLGIPMLLMTVLSFWYFTKDRAITLWSVLTLALLGLEAILGKLVVDSNLKPTMISIHLIIALLIMLLLIYLIHRTGTENKTNVKANSIAMLFIVASIITFVQIVIGIQVRQFVDEQVILIGETEKGLWLQDPLLQFYIHRTFSIFVVVLNFFIAFRIRQFNLGFTKINWVLGILLLEILSGIIMYYFDFPFATQPLHLLLASLLFGTQFYLVLEAIQARRLF